MKEYSLNRFLKLINFYLLLKQRNGDTIREQEFQEGGACGALGFLIDIFDMFFGGEGKILREKRDKREKTVCVDSQQP